MRLLVFGASGRTGKRVVALAREQAWNVAAFVRDAERSPLGVSETHVGDVLVGSDVDAAVRADDVVVSCLGGAARGQPSSDGTENVLRAMARVGARRFVGVVGAGVLQFDPQTRRSERPEYPAMLRAIGAGHQRVFEALQRTSLEWTLVCSPNLLEGDATRAMIRRADYLPEGKMAVTTGDVAALIVEEALRPRGAGRIGVNQPRA
jgi:putative NADH-flavin reductase